MSAYTLTTISYDDWVQLYKPIDNPNEEGAAFEGMLFDTHKPADVASITAADANCVWTLLDDGDSQCITNGWHYVNREGYFITERPGPLTSYLEVLID